jgi:hypothetical protein
VSGGLGFFPSSVLVVFLLLGLLRNDDGVVASVPTNTAATVEQDINNEENGNTCDAAAAAAAATADPTNESSSWTAVIMEEEDDTVASSSSSSSPRRRSSSSVSAAGWHTHPKCGLYLAPSTIPNAGIGIFTAVDLNKGEVVGFGDVCIPVVDMYWHNNDDDIEHPLFNPLKDYFWQGYAMGMSEETNREDMESYCPGLDCMINCHLGLINVEKSVPQYDDGVSESWPQHSGGSPGAGAFTPYHNGTTYVARNTPAGAELFKFYGDRWFEVREHMFGKIPLSDDYTMAQKLLYQLANLKIVKQWEHHQNRNNNKTTTTKVSQESPRIEDAVLMDLYEMVHRINRGSWESRTVNALPKSFQDALTAAHHDIAHVLQPQFQHDVSYLESNGVCIDHIRPGPSTLPYAGHGGFAVRDLPKHTTLTISPLHHFPNYQFVDMYNVVMKNPDKAGVYYRLLDEVQQFQLLYNYCFGHEDSTILLCPYGSGINYINHNQTLANVKIQWPGNEDGTSSFFAHNHTAVVDGTLDDLSVSSRPQLAFQYVTIRDIQAGEELFLDYGDEWEQAWQKHLRKYHHDRQRKEQQQKQQQADNPGRHGIQDVVPQYASAQLFNRIFDRMPLRTLEEQQLDPYPSNLETRCHRSLLAEPDDELNRHLVTYVWTDFDYGLPCRIVHRFSEAHMNVDEDDDDDEDTEQEIVTLYTVVIEWRVESLDRSTAATHITVTDVPRSGIRFFDLPYTTDLHQPTAFRYEIGIPDSMFPEKWRNRE